MSALAAALDAPALSSLRGRDFLSLGDLSPDELWGLLHLAAALKADRRAGSSLLAGRSVALLFLEPSTRTRVSAEVATCQLGGHPLFLNHRDLQLRRGETVEDTARVLSRFVDAVLVRVTAHQDVVDLAAAAAIPVINGLTSRLHPLQGLSDLFTLWERWGAFAGRKLVYLGDGNNVAHSLMLGASRVGLHVVVASPPGYGPAPEVLAQARAMARQTGARVELASDPREAVRGADAVYTDVWVSMGQEAERETRLRDLAPYQLSGELLGLARPGAVVLHCLPAHRGEEITGEVLDGPQSAVWDQAENRLHTLKAVLVALLGSAGPGSGRWQEASP